MKANWKHWLGDDCDAHDPGVLGQLHAMERAVGRMIGGVWRFWVERVPDWWWSSVSWLRSAGAYALRVGMRVVRLVLMLLAWVAVVVGPMGLDASPLTVVWAALALVGSAWGLRQSRRPHTITTASALH